jgi:HlyD family secretion protein
MVDNTNQFESFHSEIIGNPPGKLTQYGISFIFIFILIVMFFAWKIDYSDSIVSRIVINSNNPTVNVTAEYNDVVKQIFIANGNNVKMGDNVLLMKSDVNLDTINQLKQFLSRRDFIQNNSAAFNGNAMGALRNDFQVLYESIRKYNSLVDNKLNLLKKNSLINENLSLNIQLKDLINQRKLSLERKRLYENEYKRSLELSKRSLISQNKLDASHSKLIESQISSSQIKFETHKIDSLISKNKEQIILLSIENQEVVNQLKNQIESQRKVLTGELISWEKRHLIKAPIDGIISIPNNVYTHQNITNEQALFSIMPISTNLIGKIKVLEQGSGKINIGQDVTVKLDSYPFQEFGQVFGNVKNKSKSIHESFIFIEIEIKQFNKEANELTTGYGKQVKYLPNMQGTVEIITQKKNILSRIFENLISNF